MDEGEAELDVLHLLVGIFAVPGVQPHRTALGVRHQERQFAGADDRKSPGLEAGIDVSDVGDAVARHVVVIERLAELLCRINARFDGAARGLLDRGAPILQRLLQGMRCRHPMRYLQLEGFFLRNSRSRADSQQQGQQGLSHRSPSLGRKRALLSRLYLTCYLQRIWLSRRAVSVDYTFSVPSNVPWQTVIRYNQFWRLHMTIADRRLMPSGRTGVADENNHHRRWACWPPAWAVAARSRHRQRHSGTSHAGLCTWPHPRRPAGRGHRRAAR